ncbi:dimethylsulfide dehydrogenase [Prevotella melaninogenica]|nr:dimethylsulfide dehydrogenase [Prevotella melaninogenica]
MYSSLSSSSVLLLQKNRSYSFNKDIANTVNYLSFYHPLTLKIISF